MRAQPAPSGVLAIVAAEHLAEAVPHTSPPAGTAPELPNSIALNPRSARTGHSVHSSNPTQGSALAPFLHRPRLRPALLLGFVRVRRPRASATPPSTKASNT